MHHWYANWNIFYIWWISNEAYVDLKIIAYFELCLGLLFRVIAITFTGKLYHDAIGACVNVCNQHHHHHQRASKFWTMTRLGPVQTDDNFSSTSNPLNWSNIRNSIEIILEMSPSGRTGSWKGISHAICQAPFGVTHFSSSTSISLAVSHSRITVSYILTDFSVFFHLIY